nr:MAG TPA: hypothetical protein [Crassvirales sp.]
MYSLLVSRMKFFIREVTEMLLPFYFVGNKKK